MGNKKFIIIGIGEKDSYALYDVANKGTAMASAYTIRQLIENGCVVMGVVATKPFKVVCYSKSGEIAKKQASLGMVPPTKRSMTTFLKGIKPSRAEIKAAKEVAAKRRATLRANKAAKKAAQEAEKKKWMLLQKSKLQILEIGHYEEVGEYHTNASYDTYFLSAQSPSALTTLKKVLKDSNLYQGGGVSFSDIKDDIREIVDNFKDYGKITVKVKATHLDFDPKKCQCGYGSEYFYTCENNYEDKIASLSFRYSNGYEPEDVGCHHCSVETATYGATADSCQMAGFAKTLRRTKIINAGTTEHPRFFKPSQFRVIDLTY